jgi:hypothetical protein
MPSCPESLTITKCHILASEMRFFTLAALSLAPLAGAVNNGLATTPQMGWGTWAPGSLPLSLPLSLSLSPPLSLPLSLSPSLSPPLSLSASTRFRLLTRRVSVADSHGRQLERLRV